MTPLMTGWEPLRLLKELSAASMGACFGFTLDIREVSTTWIPPLRLIFTILGSYCMKFIFLNIFFLVSSDAGISEFIRIVVPGRNLPKSSLRSTSTSNASSFSSSFYIYSSTSSPISAPSTTILMAFTYSMAFPNFRVAKLLRFGSLRIRLAMRSSCFRAVISFLSSFYISWLTFSSLMNFLVALSNDSFVSRIS